MFFVSTEACHELASSLGLQLEVKSNSLSRSPPFPFSATISFESERARSYAIACKIADWFGPFETAYLMVSETGIWPSSENLHLYYKVRDAYGEKRTVGETPGHVFLKHERADLVTFLDLVVQFGWGAVLFKYPPTASMVISHDEWMALNAEERLQAVGAEAEEFGLRLLSIGTDAPH
jgi:hypothetical protein